MKLTSLLPFQSLVAIALVVPFSGTAAATTIFSDNFDTYADTAAMNAVWTNGGTATLDTANGNPGQSLSHPGTAANNSGGNTNSKTVVVPLPTGSDFLRFSADIFDDGTSVNKRISAGLRNGASNLIEMGMYQTAPAPHYAFRIVGFSGLAIPVQVPPAAGGWVRFPSLVDDNGVLYLNQASPTPRTGWHRFTVDISPTSATFKLDLFSDGFINSTLTVPYTAINAAGFNQIRLGGPSDVSSGGGGAKFDNISLATVPEPASLALVGCVLAGVIGAYRRR